MMDHIHAYLGSILQREHVQSILVINQQDTVYSILESAQFLFIVVVNQPKAQWETNHLVYQGKMIVEHQISLWQIESWAVYGADERFVSLLAQSDLVFDTHDYMKQMKERLLRLPAQLQKLRVCEEYSRFLSQYLGAKELLQQGLALDSYQSLLNALHSWARLVAYEAYQQPQTALWLQVKQLDPSVHKLYEELVISNEPLEKRIELLLLPIEFNIMSKMKTCTQVVADILQSRNRPWPIKELLQLPELANSRIDLQLLLDKMVKRSLVHEVLLPNESDLVHEKAYLLSG